MSRCRDRPRHVDAPPGQRGQRSARSRDVSPLRRLVLGLARWIGHGLARTLSTSLSSLLALLLAAAPAAAGVMTQQTIRQAFPSPLIVGERDATLPVWPIFKQDATATVLVGYVFESIDLAPIPGFSGTPLNLLVALDAKGGFLDVRVLSQHEPVFLDGLGEAPLLRFVEQYKGLSLKQSIKIGSNSNRGDHNASANVYVDGVAKATASVRILNQTLLAASLKVAREKLGYAKGRDPERVGRVRNDVYRVLDWSGLERAGLLRHIKLGGAEVERAFAGSVGEGAEPPAPGAPADTDLWITYLNAPTVGRNLLDERGWQHLLSRIDAGDHALLIVGSGRYSFVGNDFTRGAVPDRLTLRQGELPLELRDLDLDDRLALPPALAHADAKVMRVIGPAGLDPSLPLDFALRITRSKGQIFPEHVSREFRVRYQLPADYVQAASSDEKTWQSLWLSRRAELAVLGLALALLTLLLVRQHWLAASTSRLRFVRTTYLVFTLVFIGWYAQGQLSIVNLTALIQALVAHRDLGFFLYDPMTVLLWAYVAFTLVVWGRATFCGWLCPFGALQELVSLAAQRLGLRRLRPHQRVDARLKAIKYAVLAGVVLTALVSGPWTDKVVEIEPFKTAITLVFVRSWPFVLWAAALVLASALVYKGYCRYLCPLGAALAIVGRLRWLRWIPRRAECGTPCQTCRHRCEYQAIRTDGAIDYAECFQCLDCVAIHDSDQRCAPLIARRSAGRRVFAIQPLRSER